MGLHALHVHGRMPRRLSADCALAGSVQRARCVVIHNPMRQGDRAAL